MQNTDKTSQYIGLIPVWQQVQQSLHPGLVSQLEYLVGPQLIEDAMDHFLQIKSLAEILVQKIGEINNLLHTTENTEAILFQQLQPSFVQNYTQNLLVQKNLEQYVKQTNKLNELLNTNCIQKFKQNQISNTQNKPLKAQISEFTVNPEFVVKIKRAIQLEHKELEQRASFLTEAIYDHHKIERVSRQVYQKFKEARENVSIDELRRFGEAIQLKIDQKVENDDFRSQDAAERLCQSIQPHRPSIKQLQNMNNRPGTGASIIARQLPRPLSGLNRSIVE